jgi:predicted dehydrogenase
MNRRDFVKNGSMTMGAVMLGNAVSAFSRPGRKVRLGFVGVGSRGTYLLKVALGIDYVEIPAICDIVEERVQNAQKIVKDSGRKMPVGYSKGEEDFRRMVTRDDLDGILIATSWEWHTPIAVASMKAGKYAATEVPGTLKISECWELVDVYEKTGVPCMLLENYCYDRDRMAVLNMVRKGLFGELTYCECAYQHDTRFVKFGPKGELLFRGEYALRNNGNNYPTHAIGPIANCLDINRGNKFEFLTSMSTKSLGLNKYIKDKFGPDHPSAKLEYKNGDINTSHIKCYNGEVITINFDTQSPRPSAGKYLVQGTKGIWEGDQQVIHLEGKTPEHKWESFKKYREEFDHPLWVKDGTAAAKTSHGGGDFFVIREFVEAIRNKRQPAIDVYDCATWSAIVELSQTSVARGSMPVEFPDFTRGKWKNNKSIFAV